MFAPAELPQDMKATCVDERTRPIAEFLQRVDAIPGGIRDHCTRFLLGCGIDGRCFGSLAS